MQAFDIPDNGRYAPLRVLVVEPGESYPVGLERQVANDYPRTIVAFYDRRYPHTAQGQFITEYYLSDLQVGDTRTTGLNLAGGVDSWSATPEAMSFVLDHIRSLVCGHDECVVGLPCTRPYEGSNP